MQARVKGRSEEAPVGERHVHFPVDEVHAPGFGRERAENRLRADEAACERSGKKDREQSVRQKQNAVPNGRFSPAGRTVDKALHATHVPAAIEKSVAERQGAEGYAQRFVYEVPRRSVAHDDPEEHEKDRVEPDLAPPGDVRIGVFKEGDPHAAPPAQTFLPSS